MPDPISHLRAVLDPHFPTLHSVQPIGEGSDHAAWLVNDEMVVRRARNPDPDAIRREVAVLEIAGRYATLRVPQVVFTDPDEGILAYRYLPGRPLLDLPDAETTVIARALGAFLRAIHRIPVEEMRAVVTVDDDPLADWLKEARGAYPGIADTIPARQRSRVEAFLAAPVPPAPERFTFCHNDFGAEHILADPGTCQVTGIIDWADAAIADPVRDLALILRDLGPQALETALTAYGRPLTIDERARLLFHARCKLLEDLAFGLETASMRYVDAALAHLDWTFA